ncbi:replication-associated recombination protein A [Pontiella agarivorans]|uniref:Replication-associated recombination protein A n=1 Tax=Pontiella agarivorans TaxID=3038953 RepID=A0ABU5N1P2_9BACT|nr:replication-associated recombination protein A [Pontiella agarivorans]MDZ8120377.1 replication-associated recombination protein A [Pontiella agarivorans]
MDLFSHPSEKPKPKAGAGTAPLAARMRPKNLEDMVGQEHILADDKLLRRAIEADRISSIILYGPPGCGKTTLAEVIAKTTDRRFERTSGVLANVSILRKILEASSHWKKMKGQDTILFIDEIHRFNKSQQDVLLPYVENGDIIIIGATTHNPFFFINTPLNSRSQIFQLQPLSEESIIKVLTRALKAPQGLNNLVTADNEALQHLASVCEGDARRSLNALEIAALTTPPGDDGIVHLTKYEIEESVQKKAVNYDHDEDEHYDTISAFIKSVRGSDPNAAVYWLAKMLYAGEDPRFIARRLMILASEDIGNADPRGITLAVSCMQAVEFIGMPEARITLAQCTTYLACAPKSNAAYVAVNAALDDVENGRTLPVPKHLQSGPKPDKGDRKYQYAHAGEGHFVDQEYVPTDKIYYAPTNQGYEDIIRKRIEYWNSQRKKTPSTERRDHGPRPT